MGINKLLLPARNNHGHQLMADRAFGIYKFGFLPPGSRLLSPILLDGKTIFSLCSGIFNLWAALFGSFIARFQNNFYAMSLKVLG